jgi:CubicO group peptidase (beta-lactamase class C family)
MRQEAMMLTRKPTFVWRLMIILFMAGFLATIFLPGIQPGIPASAQAAAPLGPDTIPSAFFDPESVGWASVRNMTSAQFSAYFAEKNRQGYLVTDIEVDEIDGVERVGAVFQKNLDGRGWAEYRDLTDAEFSTQWTDLRDAGYRLIDQESYQLGGQQLYAGVWIQNLENLPWVSYRNATSAEFADLFDRYTAAGYLMIDVEAYPIGDTLYYSAAWVDNTENLDWVELRNLTSQEFSDAFALYQDTYRMIDVESYPWNGVQYYAGIWVKNPSGRAWAEWRDMTAKEFGDRWLILRDAGYRLINYEVYPTASGWRYAGIWRQNGIRPDWAFKGEVDAIAENYAQENAIPGMSVAVYHNGQFVYLRGFGYADVDDQVIAHSRTIYRTASVAKSVAGTLGMLLSEDNLIDLGEDTATYVPGLPAFHTHSVGQTITNRSGLGHYAEYPGISGHYDTAQDAVEQLWDVPLAFPPGTQYYYSTHAYTFLGASIEGALGDSLTNIFNTYLREPFNLNSLQPEDRSVPNKFRATLYNTENEEVEADDLSWKTLGGGLETSAYDLARFGVDLMHNTILDQPAMDMLWTPPDGLSNYAYGWDTGTDLGTRVIGKSGAQNGAGSYLRIYPDEDLVVLVLSNRRGHDPRSLCKDIAAAILGGGALSQQAPAIEAARLPLADVEEPEEEGQDPAEVIYPVESPVATPSPLDLQENDSVPVNGFEQYLPAIWH